MVLAYSGPTGLHPTGYGPNEKNATDCYSNNKRKRPSSVIAEIYTLLDAHNRRTCDGGVDRLHEHGLETNK